MKIAATFLLPYLQRQAPFRARRNSFGVIGDTRYAEAALITSDYDHSNIRMRKETFGGSTYDIGVYSLSFLQCMLGMAPEQIQAAAVLSKEGIDTFTTAVMEYGGKMRAHFDCGMVLETEKNASLDRFQIHGSKGSVCSVDFGFNAPGTLTYRLRTFDGADELRKVEVPNNYCLEVEQFGRCVRNEEEPYVTEEFSIALAGTVDKILKQIGY
ncbi:MAG: hypothetical protein HFI29_01295 [Lachnospiraceae bacterium]|nr:hypothetical protein [Lachnospiraceae bacterium]